MSADLLTPDDVVAAALRPADAPDDSQVAGEQPWEIDDRGGAEWAVAKMRQEHRSYLADVAPTLTAIDALRDEIERLEGFVEDRKARRDNALAYFEARLTGWLRDLQRDDPKIKSVRLAGGVVKSTAGRERVVIDDPDVFVFAHGDDSPFVRVKREPALKAVLDHVKACGEVPEGAQLQRSEATYAVALDGS